MSNPRVFTDVARVPAIPSRRGQGGNGLGGADKFFNTLEGTINTGLQIGGPILSGAGRQGGGHQAVNALVSSYGGGQSRSAMYNNLGGQSRSAMAQTPDIAYGGGGGGGSDIDPLAVIDAQRKMANESIAMQAQITSISKTSRTAEDAIRAARQ